MTKSDDGDNSNFTSLRDQFLIAMPSPERSIFSQSLTYICDHSEHGAMGVIITQPLGINLGDIFDQLNIDTALSIRDRPVLAGGPVSAQQGLVLHKAKGTWESTLHINSDIYLTASKDIITAMAQARGPECAQLALGYAGWGGGQLEEELSNNFWLTMPADSRILFDLPPEERFNAATKQLGIDINLVSTSAGHA